MRPMFRRVMTTEVGQAVGNFVGETRQKMRFIVGASSAGTIIEWYDFYLYGALTFVLAPIFTPVSNDPTVNFLVYLATFATGFAVRPFGALVFGRIGYLMGDTAFKAWGWRIPFLLSIALVAVSLFIRWRLKETPLFARLKAAGRTSRTPLREALASWANWKLILLALFGATSGQAVVWY